MRRTIAIFLIVLSVTFGIPAAGNAQGPSSLLSGQVVDASGRGSSGRTIELGYGGTVVGMTVSDSDGHFSFALGGSGSYIVRTIVNGHPAGVRVSVVRGETPPMALLVLPSAATSSPQIGAFISNSPSGLAGIALLTSVAVTALATQVSERNDARIIEETRARVLELMDDIRRQLGFAGPLPIPSLGG